MEDDITTVHFCHFLPFLSFFYHLPCPFEYYLDLQIREYSSSDLTKI